MIIATTGALAADPGDPIVYRGSYQDICAQSEEDGYRAIEMHIEDSAQIDRRALWQTLADHNLRLTSIGTGAVFFSRGYSLTSPDAAIRKACIAHMEAHMQTAQPYGAVVIVGCVQGRLASGQAPEAFLQRMADSLFQLDVLAEKYGVTIGLEIMNRFESDVLNTIDEGIAFLKANGFTHTKLHLDTVHMNIEETRIGDAIRRAGALIGHVHLADNDRWYPGHAHYDFSETLRALYDVHYSGALALEIKPYPDARTASRLSLSYLQGLMTPAMLQV